MGHSFTQVTDCIFWERSDSLSLTYDFRETISPQLYFTAGNTVVARVSNMPPYFSHVQYNPCHNAQSYFSLFHAFVYMYLIRAQLTETDVRGLSQLVTGEQDEVNGHTRDLSMACTRLHAVPTYTPYYVPQTNTVWCMQSVASLQHHATHDGVRWPVMSLH